MAVLSFAHLKNKKSPEKEIPQAPPSSGSSLGVRFPTRQTSAVMSFSHLKVAQKEQPAITPDTTTEEKPQFPVRSTFRIPAVMPSTLLHATNYCQGCGRFLPAAEFEKTAGNPYGRCLRSIDIDADGLAWETWKVIPPHATVERCFFHKR